MSTTTLDHGLACLEIERLPQSLERFPINKLKARGFVEAAAVLDETCMAALSHHPYRVVFVSGTFSQELSVIPEGVTLYHSEEAKTLFAGYQQWVAETFKGIDQSPFTGLGRQEHGAFMVIEEEIKEPIAIVHVGSPGEHVLSAQHLDVMVASEARVTLTSHYEGAEHEGWHHLEMRVSVEQGGACYFMDEGKGFSETSAKTVNISAIVKEQALFDGVYLSEGSLGAFTRVRGVLLEESASGSFRSLSLLKTGKSHWQDVAFYHKAEKTESHQLIKTMVQDRAFSSFAGRIDVDEVAQQTDAYQKNENILLGERAVAFAYPGLEIRADDVKASHGCVSSELDKSAAFYLRSRGIDQANVERLMIEGFCYSFIREEDGALSRDRLANLIQGFVL